MKKVFGPLIVLVFLTMFAVSSHAALYTVDAFANSSTGGSGKDTINLTAGQAFTVIVSTTDLWNAGPLPRWSNANGLTGNLDATGSDESGQPAGILIGQNWGSYSQGNLTAPYGALVGQIGAGDYFFIGTSYSGNASATGTLNLYYWDSYRDDNTEKIAANVNVVPIPAGVWLLGSGLVGLYGIRRRFTKKQK